MIVDALVIKVTYAAALLEHEGDQQWVPLALIDRDDLDIYEATDEEIEIDIPDWKAGELGWV